MEARLQELMTTTKRETFKNDDLFKLAKQAEFEKKLTVEAVDRELLEARVIKFNKKFNSFFFIYLCIISLRKKLKLFFLKKKV